MNSHRPKHHRRKPSYSTPRNNNPKVYTYTPNDSEGSAGKKYRARGCRGSGTQKKTAALNKLLHGDPSDNMYQSALPPLPANHGANYHYHHHRTPSLPVLPTIDGRYMMNCPLVANNDMMFAENRNPPTSKRESFPEWYSSSYDQLMPSPYDSSAASAATAHYKNKQRSYSDFELMRQQQQQEILPPLFTHPNGNLESEYHCNQRQRYFDFVQTGNFVNHREDSQQLFTAISRSSSGSSSLSLSLSHSGSFESSQGSSNGLTILPSFSSESRDGSQRKLTDLKGCEDPVLPYNNTTGHQSAFRPFNPKPEVDVGAHQSGLPPKSLSVKTGESFLTASSFGYNSESLFDTSPRSFLMGGAVKKQKKLAFS